MTWLVGLTDDPEKKKAELGNPSDWKQTEFKTEEEARAWKAQYIGQEGYVEDADGPGWCFGYWYSTNLIQCPDCKKMISPSAVSCPNCGRPVGGQAREDDTTGKTKCPHCGKMVQPIVTSVGGGSCSVGSREKWTCPACRRVIRRTGCFVATATYGNDDEIEVLFLRAYRDNYLRNNLLGRFFIWLYYNVSPYPAWVVLRVPLLQKISRRILDRIVAGIEDHTTLSRGAFAERKRRRS